MMQMTTNGKWPTHIHTQTLKNLLSKFRISAYFIRLKLFSWFKVNDTKMKKNFHIHVFIKNYHILKWTFIICLKLHMNKAFMYKMLTHKIQDHIIEGVYEQTKNQFHNSNETYSVWYKWTQSIILRLCLNGCMFCVVFDLICFDTPYSLSFWEVDSILKINKSEILIIKIY